MLSRPRPDSACEPVPSLGLPVRALQPTAMTLVQSLFSLGPARASATGAEQCQMVTPDHHRLVETPLR